MKNKQKKKPGNSKQSTLSRQRGKKKKKRTKKESRILHTEPRDDRFTAGIHNAGHMEATRPSKEWEEKEVYKNPWRYFKKTGQ